MRLIFVNRFFYPDHSATSQMLSDLAFGLAERGISVAVITSRLRYDNPSIPLAPRENINGVEIHRVWTSRLGRTRLLLRSLDYLTFYLALIWALLRILERGDIVVVKTDPPLASIIATPIAKLKGARIVNWLQDLFPEVAEALNVGGSPAAIFFGLMRGMRNVTLRQADMNVAIGQLMSGRLATLGIDPQHIRVIQNWADCDAIHPISPNLNDLRKDWNLRDSFVVGYSGNLGRAHEIETLLTAIGSTEADQSRRAPDETAPHPIRWLFIGGGALFEELRKEAPRRALRTVDFRPYQPRDRLSESLSAADVHIVSLRPELEGLIVPSKFYGIAAAGRPVVNIGSPDGEIARLIEQHHCGVTVAAGDGHGLAAAIAALANDRNGCQVMGENARTFSESSGGQRGAIAAWQKLIDELATKPERDLR